MKMNVQLDEQCHDLGALVTKNTLKTQVKTTSRENNHAPLNSP